MGGVAAARCCSFFSLRAASLFASACGIAGLPPLVLEAGFRLAIGLKLRLPQRIVVVDDSIVRGNTTRQIIGMLRDAGASEVHLRISAPPIRHPCHYGIDMSTREEMIAHERTEAEIAAELGADSLAYLSLEGVYAAIEGDRATHCDACFSGEYPLAGTAEAQSKDAFEHALPLARL